jgi:hypothetical protein
MQVSLVEILIAPAVHLDFDFLRQFTAEVLDVNASSAIDIGWIFAGHQTNAHDVPPGGIKGKRRQSAQS